MASLSRVCAKKSQLGVRRVLQQGLARGWSTWRESHLEKARRHALLQAAVGRFSHPQLSSAVAFWRQDWAAEEAAKEAGKLRAALAAEVRILLTLLCFTLLDLTFEGLTEADAHVRDPKRPS